MFRIEHDTSTGEITEIELTDEEIKELKKAAGEVQAIVLAEKAEYDAKVEIIAKEKAAVLARLGITEDEAKLLLG